MAEALQAINVTVSSDRNLKVQPFITAGDQISNGRAWEDWIEGIEREFRYFKIVEPQDKKYALLIFGGKEISRLAKVYPTLKPK